MSLHRLTHRMGYNRLYIHRALRDDFYLSYSYVLGITYYPLYTRVLRYEYVTKDAKIILWRY
jgi:hypothetical protein